MSAISEINNAGTKLTIGRVLSAAFENAALGWETFKDGLENSTGIIGNVKAAFSGLWQIISNHPIVATVAAIGLLAVAFDTLYVSAQEANDKMMESFDAYENAKQSVSDTNTELETTKIKMDELLTKGSLTFIEEDELQRLKDATEQLTLQADLQEKAMIRSAKEAASDTVNAYRKNYKDGSGIVTSDKISEYYNHGKGSSHLVGLSTDIEHNGDLSAMIAATKIIKNLRDETEKSSEDYADFNQWLEDVEGSVWDEITALSKYKDILDEIPYDELSTEQKAVLDEINTTIEQAYLALEPGKWNQMQFDKIFDSSALMQAKNDLIELAKASGNVGITIDDVKNKYPALAEAVENAGFSIEDLVNNINSEANIKDIDKLTASLKEGYEKDLQNMQIESNVEVESDVDVEPNINVNKEKIEQFNNWIDSLSNEQKVIAYTVRATEDTSTWTLDDWQQRIIDTGDTAQEVSGTLEDFYTILNNTEDGNFTDSLENYTSKLDTLNESLVNFNSGELSDSDIVELMKQFPQLTQYTDNLSTGIQSVMNDLIGLSDEGEVATGLMALFDEQITALGENTAGAEAMRTLRDEILKLYDTTEAVESLTESSTILLSQLEAVNSALSSQSTGKSIDFEAFSSEELQDYQSALEYVNGSMQINADKAREIAKAKAEEQIATNDANKALLQADYVKNAAEIDILRQKIEDCSFAEDENAYSVQSQIDALLLSNSEIISTCNSLDVLNRNLREATGTYQAWLNAQNAPDYGDMFNDSLNAIQAIRDVADSTSDSFGDIGTNKYKAAVDFVVPDSVDKEDAYAVQSYLDSIEHLYSHDENGKRDGLNLDEFLNSAVEQGLMTVDESGSDFQLAGEMTMERFAEGMNLSLPLVQAFFDELTAKGAEFEFTDTFDTFGDGIMACTQSVAELEAELKKLNDDKEAGIEVDDSKINEVSAKLDEVTQKKKELEEASVMNIEANMEIDSKIAEATRQVQGFQTSYDANPTIEVKTKLENAQAELAVLQQEKDKLQEPTIIEISGYIGDIDRQIAELETRINNLNSEDYKKEFHISDEAANAELAELEGKLQSLKDKKTEVQTYADTNESMSKLKELSEIKIDDKKFSVNVVDKASSILRNINNMHLSDKTLTITTNKVTVESTVKKGSISLNGTAHASGTALANGSWGATTGGMKLMGELGREILVNPYTGKWRTYGDNGAEFAYVPKGSIVFNHLQSESLLERGWVNGRGTTIGGSAFASGTALATGVSGGINLNRIPNYKPTPTTPTTATSTNTSAQASNTAATKANTAAKEENTKSTKESISTFDWVKTKLDRFAKNVERISNRITDYISLNLKSSLLKKQIAAMDKQINAQQSGYDTYMAKANSIELSSVYKSLVQSGDFKIEDIDTSTDSGKKLADNISKYQEYYEAALDCKDAVVDLKNEQLELFEQWANIPTEKAEKAIEKLQRKYESLSAVQSAATGGSAIAALANVVNADNPQIKTTNKALKEAKSTQTKTAAEKKSANKELKSAKSDYLESGTKLDKDAKNATNKAGKALKAATKNQISKTAYNAISVAVRNRQKVNTKGLKGEALKAAKAYNKALKQETSIVPKVSAGKKVSTKGLSGTLKKDAKAYNAEVKDLQKAQKEYDEANKANKKALSDLAEAQSAKDSSDRATTTQQRNLTLMKEGQSTYIYQNKFLDQELSLARQENAQRQKALKTATKNVDKQQAEYDKAIAARDKKAKSLLKNKDVQNSLNDTQKAALKAGKTVSTKGIASESVLKQIEDYNKLVSNSSELNTKLNILLEAQADAVANAAQAEAEYAQMMVENEQKKLENISNYFESTLTQFANRESMLDGYMTKAQLQGNVLSTKFYEAQIANEQNRIQQLQAQREAMQKTFTESVQKGIIREGTEEYWQMQDAIDQVSVSIVEAENNVLEFNNAIRDLDWEKFDMIQESISRIADESDFLIDLLSNKKLFDDKGELTDEGWATMGLHGLNYNTYMTQADKYKEEMDKINKQIADDPYNQDLIKRRNELLDLQQESILAAEAEKDAIVDLVEDGIQYELDSLKELIDSYLDAIEAEKDLHDYQKKIKDQTEEIASLEKQLSALKGDNSEESKAKIQEIKVALKDARENLEDTQYDRYISEQKKLLDDLYNQYEEILNRRLDNVDALVEEMIGQINANSSLIQNTLITETDKVGYTLTPEMQNIWSATNGVGDVITMYGDNFCGQMTSLQGVVGNIYTKMDSMIAAINAQASSYIQAVDKIMQPPTVPEEDKAENFKPAEQIGAEIQDKNNNSDSLIDNNNNKNNSNKNNKNNKNDKENSDKKNGDGKPKVGDTCTFVSGKYYEASDGSGKTGNLYLGKKVKITGINTAPWAKYPYSIRSADGKTGLGWVKLDQLKGYASGTPKINDDMLAWTQELGSEVIIRPSDGAVLTPLNRGDMVLDNEATMNMWKMANDPSAFIRNNIVDMPKISDMPIAPGGQSIDNHFEEITFHLPNVIDPKDFVNEMAKNKMFEKLVQSMTVDRMVGKSSLNKYKFRR